MGTPGTSSKKHRADGTPMEEDSVALAAALAALLANLKSDIDSDLDKKTAKTAAATQLHFDSKSLVHEQQVTNVERKLSTVTAGHCRLLEENKRILCMS